MKTLKDVADSHLVARYVASSPHFRAEAPTLAASLTVFGASDRFRRAVAALSPRADCLIQGYTAPGNAAALRDSLAAQGIETGRIVAIDQLPLPRIYRQLGVAMPEIEFLQTDACDLGDRLDGRRFDLVVQDFILNCLPPAAAPALLREARRHLKSGGLGLLSFSADAGSPADQSVPAATALAPWPGRWTPAATGLQDLAGSEADFEAMAARLMGRSIHETDTGRVTHVTAPSGQFEFFLPRAEIMAMLGDAGFAVTVVDVAAAVDYNGLSCNRYRVIATPL